VGSAARLLTETKAVAGRHKALSSQPRTVKAVLLNVQHHNPNTSFKPSGYRLAARNTHFSFTISPAKRIPPDDSPSAMHRDSCRAFFLRSKERC
jgi:hypothetical protein